MVGAPQGGVRREHARASRRRLRGLESGAADRACARRRDGGGLHTFRGRARRFPFRSGGIRGRCDGTSRAAAAVDDGVPPGRREPCLAGPGSVQGIPADLRQRRSLLVLGRLLEQETRPLSAARDGPETPRRSRSNRPRRGGDSGRSGRVHSAHSSPFSECPGTRPPRKHATDRVRDMPYVRSDIWVFDGR